MTKPVSSNLPHVDIFHQIRFAYQTVFDTWLSTDLTLVALQQGLKTLGKCKTQAVGFSDCYAQLVKCVLQVVIALYKRIL